MAKLEMMAPEPEIVVAGDMDDGSVELEPEPGDEPEEAIVYDINAPNMMAGLMSTKKGKEAVRKLAAAVDAEVQDAWEAQSEYREIAKQDWLLWRGNLPKKTEPFEGCANAHVPSMLEDGSRLYMRMFTEAIGDGTEVFSVAPVGPDDQEVAELLSRHGNWQLQNVLTDFYAQAERAAMFFIMPGDVTCHSFYDPARRRNRHEMLTPDDFIVPYVHTTTEPDYSDCPWVAKWMRMYKHQLQKNRLMWHDVDAVINARKPSFEDEPDAPLAQGQKEADGNEPGEDQRAPYKLLHYEGWVELPNEPDEQFCKIVMDWTTKRVLQIQLLMEEDWQDAARFKKQTGELEQYRAVQQQYQAALMAPPPPPPVQTVDPNTGGLLPPPPPPPPPAPPVAPPWAEDPAALDDPAFELETVRQVPIHMFTHGKGIEPPHGPLGTGVGRVLADLNKAANIALCQAIDAATLANGQTFLQAGGSSSGKPFRIVPGRVNVIPDMSARDAKEALIPVPIPPANPQMLDMVEKFREYSEAASSAPSVLSGEAGKSGETYRGIQTRVEQATKQISFITGKYIRFLANIIKNNARLNSQFLPEDEVVMVNNHKLGTVQELRVGRQMYARDYRVVMTSDLRFASQAARVAEADQVLAQIVALPQLGQNFGLLQMALKEVFTSRGKDNLVPFLGPPMPPPQTPLGMPPPAPPQEQPGAAQQQPAQPEQPQPPAMPSAPQPGPNVQ